MKIAIAILAALLAGQTSPPRSQTYLASIEGIRLKDGEGIASFELRTWGVVYRAVCHIPYDWEVTAGSMGPGGKLAGTAGHGTSWVRASDKKQLQALVLIRLDGPVQKRDIPIRDGVVPATFSGVASVESGDRSTKVRLTFANVRLTPARACPPQG
jgi:hypothetical protein